MLMVPPGSKGGDIIGVPMPDGQTHFVTIPAGVSGGEKFEIDLPSAGKAAPRHKASMGRKLSGKQALPEFGFPIGSKVEVPIMVQGKPAWVPAVVTTRYPSPNRKGVVAYDLIITRGGKKKMPKVRGERLRPQGIDPKKVCAHAESAARSKRALCGTRRSAALDV